MKLYEIPRNSKIKAETYSQEEGKRRKKIGDYIIFHRLDGAYSYCTIEGTDQVCHLGASTELKLNDQGYYELA